MGNARRLAVKAMQQLKINKVLHKFYYNNLHGFNTAQKEVLPALEKSLNRIFENGAIENGDYCEFGIFKGYAFWYAQNTAAKMGMKNMRFFGFDSFQGLPEIDTIDQTNNGVFYKGQYAQSLENVKKDLNKKRVDWNKTFLIKGFFDKTLNDDLKEKYSLKKISLALIDCDLYTSTADVLNFIGDLIFDETILMFDDWNCFDKDNNRGQRRALKEFLEKNPIFTLEELFSYGTWGQVFIVRKK